MRSIANHPGLKTILLLDAATCTAVAVLQFCLSQVLSQWLGLAVPLLMGSAVFLLVYSGLLLGMARASNIWHWLLRLVVWGNVAWGLGCLLLAFSAGGVTQLGTAYLLLQAIVVFAIAACQWSMGRKGPAPLGRTQQA